LHADSNENPSSQKLNSHYKFKQEKIENSETTPTKNEGVFTLKRYFLGDHQIN